MLAMLFQQDFCKKEYVYGGFALNVFYCFRYVLLFDCLGVKVTEQQSVFLLFLASIMSVPRIGDFSLMDLA